MEKKDFIKLSNMITNYIDSLSESEFYDLLNGKKLLCVKKKELETTYDVDSLDIENTDGRVVYILEKLNTVKTVIEAKIILNDKKITNAILREVADNLGLYIKSKSKKQDIINVLLDETVVLRLKMQRTKKTR